MTKLAYTNIFESIEPNKKKAARMQAASHAVLDLRDILEEMGVKKKKAAAIVDAVFDRTMARYNGKSGA